MTIIKYEKNAAGDDIPVDDLVYHSKPKQPLTTNNIFYKDCCDKLMEDVKKSHNEQTLTEQWKKGELEKGWYYVKNEFGNIFISEYSKDYDFIGERVISGFFTEVSEITEIICEVPSYEQWQSLNEIIDSMNDTNKALAHRLNMLKELLKECNKTFFEIRLSLSSGKINSVFDLSYQRENDINEVLK